MEGIKNVGGAAVDHILTTRASEGAFASFLDFLERIDTRSVNRKVIETLVFVGAFDSLGQNRATLTANIETYLEAASHTRESRLSGQGSLFGEDETGEESLSIEQQPPWDTTTRLDYERELLGAYFSGHPLDDYREEWDERTTINLSHPEKVPSDETVQVVGLLRALRTVVTKKGERMAIGTLEDFRGEIELVAFPSSYKEHYEALVVTR